MPRFVNLWDAGVSSDLVTSVAAVLDAADEGDKPNRRFVTVREDKGAPPSAGERRLLLPAKDATGKKQDPMTLVNRLRTAASVIGVRQFYVPKGTRGALIVGAEDARWLRTRGHSAQAIADLFGVSQRSAFVVVRATKVKEGGASRRNHGDSFDETDFRVGAEWLRDRRLPGDPTSAGPRDVDDLVKVLGPARIARVGAALRDLRAAKRSDPPVMR